MSKALKELKQFNEEIIKHAPAPQGCSLGKDRVDMMREIAGAEITFRAPIVRQFDTGATRDTDTDKHDPEAFLSPIVLARFNEYMHRNRKQKDGSYRDGDNWQKGIPRDAYMKSMWRHFLDLWLYHRGYRERATEDIETALCAIMFNAMGYLFEVLREKDKPRYDRSRD
jgi:hypothetical protein